MVLRKFLWGGLFIAIVVMSTTSLRDYRHKKQPIPLYSTEYPLYDIRDAEQEFLKAEIWFEREGQMFFVRREDKEKAAGLLSTKGLPKARPTRINADGVVEVILPDGMSPPPRKPTHDEIRANQISRRLSSLDGISPVAVRVIPPVEKTYFSDKYTPYQALVTLSLGPNGAISSESLQAAVDAIVSAAPEIPAEYIRIVDDDGRPLYPVKEPSKAPDP